MTGSGLLKGIYFLIVTIFFTFPNLSKGQINFLCQISDDRVEHQSSFLLTYVIENGELDDIQTPKVSGLRIDSGPGVETSLSIINGKRSGYVRYTYNVYAEKIGSYTIPPAKARINGKYYLSNSVSVQVIKASQKDLSSDKKDVFFKAILSKNKIYLGEQTHLSYDIYTRKEIINADFERMPQFSHVFVKPLEKSSVGKNIVLNNKNYYTQTIEYFVLYAQKSGRHFLEKIPIQYKYEVENSRNPFFNEIKIEKYYTNDLTLDVLEIPKKGVPISFSGGVGDFSFSTNISKQNLTTDEVIKVEMVIKGDGDPKFWTAPKWEPIEDVEFFEPNFLNESVHIENGREYYTRTYEYIIQVKKPKDFILQPKFSYFSPDSEKYITLEDKTSAIKVLQGENHLEESQIIDESKSENIDQNVQDKNKFSTNILFLVIGFSLIGGIVFWIFRLKKHRQKINEDNHKIQAKKIADLCLEQAKAYKDSGESRPFFEEISHTLTGYFKNKLGLENEELEKTKLVSILKSKNISENNILIFEKIYNTCELALFAGQNPDISNIYDETRELITTLEGYFTKNVKL